MTTEYHSCIKIGNIGMRVRWGGWDGWKRWAKTVGHLEINALVLKC